MTRHSLLTRRWRRLHVCLRALHPHHQRPRQWQRHWQSHSRVMWNHRGPLNVQQLRHRRRNHLRQRLWHRHHKCQCARLCGHHGVAKRSRMWARMWVCRGCATTTVLVSGGAARGYRPRLPRSPSCGRILGGAVKQCTHDKPEGREPAQPDPNVAAAVAAPNLGQRGSVMSDPQGVDDGLAVVVRQGATELEQLAWVYAPALK
jgi:hypothetical protein